MEDFNTQLNNLKINLINTINKSGIPVGVIYYLLKDILTDVADSYKQSILIEQQVQSIKNTEKELDKQKTE